MIRLAHLSLSDLNEVKCIREFRATRHAQERR